MLLARDIQRYRACTSGNQDVSSLELPAFGNNHILTGEAGNPVKGVDAVFGEIFFQIAGDCIGEAAFKHHQVAPINPRLACDAMRASAGADDHEIVGLHNVVSLEASDRTSKCAILLSRDDYEEECRSMYIAFRY